MEPFLGQIQCFGFSFPPRGWALCNGQILPINQNQALFSLLGTTYGGDGRTTFGLPDLRGRVATHFGTGPGLTPRILGQEFGQEQVTLNVSEIPSHTHQPRCQSNVAAGHVNTPVDATWATDAGVAGATYSTVAPNANMLPASISNTGGGAPHTNIQPTIVLNWCIALTGLFPSRS
ncbi:MAG: tail fiber protein [Planctomycetota bacterium]